MFSVAEARSWARDQEAERIVRQAIRGRAAEAVSAEWEPRLRSLWPKYFPAPFAPHHVEFWDQINAVELGDSPPALLLMLARGGAKSTNAEAATADLGIREKRRYALYVCATQDAADKHVLSVADMLESEAVERYFPDHAGRAVNKYRQSKGWRRDRLVTAGGFVVDGIGLDVAVRGVKFEEQRPDLIILDDIDGKHDTPQTTLKKIEIITTNILPAGATGQTLVIGAQNLIIPDGVFTRLADGRADYLHDRHLIGPHPALRDMEVDWEEDEDSAVKRPVIVAGTPTWAGQDLDDCQSLMDDIGYSAFLKECQHAVAGTNEGIALQWDGSLEHLSDEDVERLVGMGELFAGIDFGDWRFGFNLRAADTDGVAHQLYEFFSQREGLEHRARIIWCICQHLGVRTLRIWGDAANPQDIREINLAFRRMQSPLRVRPVLQENKARRTAVERANDLLKRNALRYRANVAEATQEAVRAHWKAEWGEEPDVRTWRLGYNAASMGTETGGSRLQWEAKHWKYPVPKEGEAQRQDPDDHTADGADLIAADRYALMSWWKAAHEEEESEPHDRNEDRGLRDILTELEKAQPASGPVRTGAVKVKRKAVKRRKAR